MSSVSLSVGDFWADLAAADSTRRGPAKFLVYQVCGFNDDGEQCWSQTYANYKDAEELYNRTVQHERVVIYTVDVY